MKMRQELEISERRACGLIGIARTTVRRVVCETVQKRETQGAYCGLGACPTALWISAYP